MLASDPVALIQALKIALSERSRSKSNGIVDALLKLAPPLGARWKSLAAISKTNGEVAAANAAMDAYAREAGNTALVEYERAAVLAQTGRLIEAEKIMLALPGSIPTVADNAYTKGTIAANLGKLEIAKDNLLAAISANPRSGQSYLALAMLGKIQTDDADLIESARPIMTSDGIAPVDKASYLYALGKLYSEAGRIDDATSAFGTGAAHMRKIRPYNVASDKKNAQDATEGWTANKIDNLANSIDDRLHERAIFVTGLPRSGTTLVEQILASHSSVQGGEELGFFRILQQDIGSNRLADLERYLDQGGSLEGLKALYNHLLDERHPGSGRFVDKSLNASRHLGLAASLFRKAPIIWVRRAPLDCAWSAFHTWFLSGISWSWSLTDIAAHMKLEDQLFDYWRHELGGRILVVDYAQLVGDPKNEIARICKHCDLPLEESQLNFHETKRAITTASVSQVREPINRKGIDSALPYSDFLQPFIRDYCGESGK